MDFLDEMSVGDTVVGNPNSLLFSETLISNEPELGNIDIQENSDFALGNIGIIESSELGAFPSEDNVNTLGSMDIVSEIGTVTLDSGNEIVFDEVLDIAPEAGNNIIMSQDMQDSASFSIEYDTGEGLVAVQGTTTNDILGDPYSLTAEEMQILENEGFVSSVYNEGVGEINTFTTDAGPMVSGSFTTADGMSAQGEIGFKSNDPLLFDEGSSADNMNISSSDALFNENTASDEGIGEMNSLATEIGSENFIADEGASVQEDAGFNDTQVFGGIVSIENTTAPNDDFVLLNEATANTDTQSDVAEYKLFVPNEDENISNIFQGVSSIVASDAYYFEEAVFEEILTQETKDIASQESLINVYEEFALRNGVVDTKEPVITAEPVVAEDIKSYAGVKENSLDIETDSFIVEVQKALAEVDGRYSKESEYSEIKEMNVATASKENENIVSMQEANIENTISNETVLIHRDELNFEGSDLFSLLEQENTFSMDMPLDGNTFIHEVSYETGMNYLQAQLEILSIE